MRLPLLIYAQARGIVPWSVRQYCGTTKGSSLQFCSNSRFAGVYAILPSIPNPGFWLFTVPGDPFSSIAAERQGAIAQLQVSSAQVSSVRRLDGAAGITVVLNDTVAYYLIASLTQHTVSQLTTAAVLSLAAGVAGSPGYNDTSAFLPPLWTNIINATNTTEATNTTSMLIANVTTSRFNRPGGMASWRGSGIVADTGNRRIRMINGTNRWVSTIAGTDSSVGQVDGDALAVATFLRPTSVAVRNDMLYIGDGGTAIRRLNLNWTLLQTAIVSTVCGSISVGGYAEGSCSGSARFLNISAIWADAGGLVIADAGRIRNIYFAADDSATTTEYMAGNGSTFSVSSSTTILAENATFDGFVPYIWRRGATEYYVMDNGSNTIRLLTEAMAPPYSTILVKTLSGRTNGPGGSTDGPVNQATYSDLGGIAVCPNRRVYVADGNVIREIPTRNPATDVTKSFSSPFIRSVTNLICTEKHEIYGTASGDNSVIRLNPYSGTVNRYAGTGSAGFALGSIPSTATFNQPRALVYIPSDGNVVYQLLWNTTIVADYGSNLLRLINMTTNTVVKNFGTGARASIDGPEGTYAFRGPCGLAFQKGNALLWVAECDSGNIIKFLNISSLLTGGSSVRVAVGTPSVFGSTWDGSPVQFLSGPSVYLSSVFGALVSDFSQLYFFDGNLLRQHYYQVWTWPGGSFTSDSQSKLSYDLSSNYRDGTLTLAAFNKPVAVAFAFGELWVSDNGNRRVRRVAFSPTRYADDRLQVSVLAGTGTCSRNLGTMSANILTSSSFAPTSVVSSGWSDLYFTDIRNKLVFGTGSRFNNFISPASVIDLSSAYYITERRGLLQISIRDQHIIYGLQQSNSWSGFVTCGSVGQAGFVDRTDCLNNGGSARLNNPGGLVFPRDQTLVVADTGNNRIRGIDMGGIYTDAGPIITLVGDGDAGVVDAFRGIDAKCNRPLAIVYTFYGNPMPGSAANYTIYWTEEGAPVVRRAEIDTGVSGNYLTMNVRNVVTIAGDRTDRRHQDGAGMNARFVAPMTIAEGYNGLLYIGDGPLLKRLAPVDNYVSTIMGQIDPDAKSYRTGLANTAFFVNITSVAMYHPDRSLMIVDQGSCIVLAMSNAGNAETYWKSPIPIAGNGTRTAVSVNGPSPTTSSFSSMPRYIKECQNRSSGYREDSDDGRWTFISEGNLVRVVQPNFELYTFAFPSSVEGITCIDSMGSVGIALRDSRVIVDLYGNPVAGVPTVQGTQDGPLLAGAMLHSPVSPSWNSLDNSIAFAETNAHIIRIIYRDEDLVVTVAGRVNTAGSSDGDPLLQATFTNPTSVAADRHRPIIYIVEALNGGRIRRLNLMLNTVDTFLRMTDTATWTQQPVGISQIAVSSLGSLFISGPCQIWAVSPRKYDPATATAPMSSFVASYIGIANRCQWRDDSLSSALLGTATPMMGIDVNLRLDFLWTEANDYVARRTASPTYGIQIIAGSDSAPPGCTDSDNGMGSNITFTEPYGITWACCDYGNKELNSLIVTDRGCGAIRVIRRFGSFSITSRKYFSPKLGHLLYVPQQDSVLVANEGYNNLLMVSIRQKGQIYPFGGARFAPWPAGNRNGLVTDPLTRFDQPTAIILSMNRIWGSRGVYMVGELACRIRLITIQTGMISSFIEGTGSNPCSSTDGQRTSSTNTASVGPVYGLTVFGGEGTVYFGESSCLRRILLIGVNNYWVATLAGDCTKSGWSVNNANQLLFTNIRSVSNTYTNVFISCDHAVLLLDVTNFPYKIKTLAGGSMPYSEPVNASYFLSRPTGMPSVLGRLNRPTAVLFSPQSGFGNSGLFVVDTGNRVLRHLNSDFDLPFINQLFPPSKYIAMKRSRTVTATPTPSTTQTLSFSYSMSSSFSTTFSITAGSSSLTDSHRTMTLTATPTRTTPHTITRHRNSQTAQPTSSVTISFSGSYTRTQTLSPTLTLPLIPTPPLTDTPSLTGELSSTETQTVTPPPTPTPTRTVTLFPSPTDSLLPTLSDSFSATQTLEETVSRSRSQSLYPTPYLVANVTTINQGALMNRGSTSDTRSLLLRAFGSEFDLTVLEADQKSENALGDASGVTEAVRRTRRQQLLSHIRLRVVNNSEPLGFQSRRQLHFNYSSLTFLNRTHLVIVFHPADGYYAQHNEVLELSLSGDAFVTRKDGAPTVVTLSTPYRASLSPGVVTAASAAVTSASVIGGALSGASAAQAARSRAILALDSCSFDWDTPLYWVVYPIGVPIGTEKVRYYVGQIILNPVLLLGIALLHLWIGHLVSEIKKVKFTVGLTMVRFPHFTLMPVMFLMQDSISGIVVVLTVAQSSYYKIAAMICALAWIAFLVALAYALVGKFSAEFRVPPPVDRRSPFVAFFIGQGDWEDLEEEREGEDGEEEEEDEDAARKVLDEPASGSDLGFAAKDKTLVPSDTNKPLLRSVQLEEMNLALKDVNTRQKSENSKAVLATKAPARKPSYCLMFGSAFDCYRSGRQWFLTFEILLTVACGIIMGVRPTDGNCQPLTLATLIALAIFLVLIVALRPYYVALNQITNVLLALLLFLSTLLLYLGNFLVSQAAALRTWGSLCAVVAMYVATAKSVSDLLILSVDAYYAIRSPSKEKQLNNLANIVESIQSGAANLAGKKTAKAGKEPLGDSAVPLLEIPAEEGALLKPRRKSRSRSRDLGQDGGQGGSHTKPKASSKPRIHHRSLRVVEDWMETQEPLATLPEETPLKPLASANNPLGEQPNSIALRDTFVDFDPDL